MHWFAYTCFPQALVEMRILQVRWAYILLYAALLRFLSRRHRAQSSHRCTLKQCSHTCRCVRMLTDQTKVGEKKLDVASPQTCLHKLTHNWSCSRAALSHLALERCIFHIRPHVLCRCFCTSRLNSSVKDLGILEIVRHREALRRPSEIPDWGSPSAVDFSCFPPPPSAGQPVLAICHSLGRGSCSPGPARFRTHVLLEARHVLQKEA